MTLSGPQPSIQPIHQHVEGYEEVFEIHAAPPFVRGVVEAAMESGRVAARLRPPIYGWPLLASFSRVACARPARSGEASTIRPGVPRCRTLVGCRDVHDSILLKD